MKQVTLVKGVKALINVEMADMQITDDANSVLVAPSLGSCIGITLYDPESKIGAMLHFILPLSKADPEKADKVPCMFADTGVPLLFKEFVKAGANRSNIQVKLAGGSELMKGIDGGFSIGKRNYIMLKKMFMKNKIEIQGEDVGGNDSRNLILDISSGRCIVKSNGNEKEL